MGIVLTYFGSVDFPKFGSVAELKWFGVVLIVAGFLFVIPTLSETK